MRAMGNDYATVEQLCEVIDLLSPCMDDYLYVCDFQNDFYYISPQAVKRFPLPANSFHQVTETHRKFVFPEDFPALQMELHDLQTGSRCTHNMIYRWMSETGRPIWINCRGYVVRDEAGQPLYMVGCINEVGMRQQADNVSGLLGETSMEMRINEMLANGLLSGIKPSGFLLRIGVDDLRSINARLGIEYGDLMLQKTASAIQQHLLPGQKLYHVSGDEFVILDFVGGTKEDAQKLYNEIRASIEQMVEEMDYESLFTISGGVVTCQEVENLTYSNLMKLTEFTLSTAKARGRNRCYLFSREDYQRFVEKRELTRQLRQAVNHNFEGFEAYFQPVYETGLGQISGAEALLRFHSDRFGLVSPGRFIPILEETGLIIPVGRWVLRQAVGACKLVQKSIPAFHVNVNLSPIQVMKSNVSRDILTTVDEFLLSPSSLTIELTESDQLESDSRFLSMWHELKNAGVRLALDDFGSGYSNFRYLSALSPDIIKIDRIFTARAMQADFEYQLLMLFCNMVHSLNLHLCIEGTETKEEVSRIKQLFPEYIQGYYFGKPSPFNTFQEMLKQ